MMNNYDKELVSKTLYVITTQWTDEMIEELVFQLHTSLIDKEIVKSGIGSNGGVEL